MADPLYVDENIMIEYDGIDHILHNLKDGEIFTSVFFQNPLLGDFAQMDPSIFLNELDRLQPYHLLYNTILPLDGKGGILETENSGIKYLQSCLQKAWAEKERRIDALMELDDLFN